MIPIKTILLATLCAVVPAMVATPLTAMADAPGTSAASDKDYNACCQVLKSIIDAYDRNDAPAVQALCFFKPGTDPRTIAARQLLLELGVADYRLSSAATSHFGIHGAMLMTGIETDTAEFQDLLSQTTSQNAKTMGDVLSITPPPKKNSEPWPLYFSRADGTWKMDLERSARVTVRAVRRHRIEGETPDQAFAASINLIVTQFNAIADDIDKGAISDEAEAQRRTSAVWGDLNSQFREFSVHSARPR